MDSMKETNLYALDAIALYRAWDNDPAGFTLFIAKASPEVLRATVTHVMVLAKMIALKPEGQSVDEYLKQYESALHHDLESGLEE